MIFGDSNYPIPRLEQKLASEETAAPENNNDFFPMFDSDEPEELNEIIIFESNKTLQRMDNYYAIIEQIIAEEIYYNKKWED